MDFLTPLVAWLYWDPPKEAFTIPVIDRPIVWYGICFVFGFLVGYLMMIPVLKRHLEGTVAPSELHKTCLHIADRLLWFLIAGTLIGARLGEVFFYDWPYYKNHFTDIFKIWNGGLASHGGTVGVLLAIFLFYRTMGKKYGFSFLGLIDMIAVPTAFVIGWIRIGNFFNQEILGQETTLPWAIVFGHPADGSIPAPRHPAQLYEAGAYFLIFSLLYYLWNYRNSKLTPGLITGLFFTLVFGARFLIEFLKTPLSLVIDETSLHMGQYLSIPFILGGILLLYKSVFFLPRTD
jgi:prolipoprotein diacylglyceryl transferase